jgi:hypothetical protein
MFEYNITQNYIGDMVKRIKQPLPPAPTSYMGTLISKGLDALGIGSSITRVQKDQADARVQLTNWVNDPRNIVHFKGLAPSQQEGIRSLLTGENQ